THHSWTVFWVYMLFWMPLGGGKKQGAANLPRPTCNLLVLQLVHVVELGFVRACGDPGQQGLPLHFGELLAELGDKHLAIGKPLARMLDFLDQLRVLEPA